MKMQVVIGAEIRIRNSSKLLQDWCRENLVLKNQKYEERKRRGFWTGNTPEYLWLYRIEGDELVVPVGVGRDIRKFLGTGDQVRVELADNGKLAYSGKVPLYDYQVPAVEKMSRNSCGILKSPCGSGKTQMGIALAAKISRRTLWITHTQDLLSQSYDRAAQYFPKETLGKITAGKVQIGSHMTFATIQTLYKLDLEKYRNTWDVVIVDECHRLAGTPTTVTMFYKVLNSLAARYKYGLSATVHRSDGLIKSTFAVIGPVGYEISDEAVAEKTVKVRINQRDTGIKVKRECLDTDGTLDHAKLIPYLTENLERNRMVAKDLVNNAAHYNLILSDRLEHLRVLMEMLPKECRSKAAMIDGKMSSGKARKEREQAIKDMRTGEKHFLFASFGLAKEGLDIPRLDRLYMTTPKKDFAVVTQSIGRIARAFDGKEEAVCYDYVDDIVFCQNQYQRRRTHYRQAGCIL